MAEWCLTFHNGCCRAGWALWGLCPGQPGHSSCSPALSPTQYKDPKAGLSGSLALLLELHPQTHWNMKSAYLCFLFIALQILFMLHRPQIRVLKYGSNESRPPADPRGWLRQIHIQCSQQQIYVVDPQIYTESDCFETPNTHLTQHTAAFNISSWETCKKCSVTEN